MIKELRRQHPIRGGREKMYSGVERRIMACVERDSSRYYVSKPYVMSVILAKHYNITIDESFDQTPKLRRVK
jgi:hypothetical protein